MTSEILGLLARANLAAGVAILMVLALRTPVAQRFGARAAYALWVMAPLAAAASLLPARQAAVEIPETMVAPLAVGPAFALPAVQQVLTSAAWDPNQLLLPLWLAGAAVLFATLAWRQAGFMRALGRLSPEEGVHRAEARGVGPALLGVLRPRIVIPADFEATYSAEERAIILAHERMHLARRDPLANGAAALAQCLCWFNPLVHIAAYYLKIDQELACDAAVVGERAEARKSYAEAMLKAQVAPIAAPLGCHWPARGAHPLKLRLARLKAPAPSAGRRAAGFALVAAASLAASAAAWAAQPAQVVVKASADPGWRAEERREIAAARAVRPIDRSLVEAVLVGDEEGVADLVKAGAHVNASVMGDGSPLIVAARSGRLDIVEYLVAHGADVNGFVLFDETPLINASRSGHLKIVAFLLDHGADPNRAVPSGNRPGELRSPLGMARTPKVAEYLKSRGARS